MTKEEADKKLSKHQAKPLGFCPVIKTECRLDCVSYEKPRVVNQYGKFFYFQQESCSSPLVTGVVEAYNQ